MLDASISNQGNWLEMQNLRPQLRTSECGFTSSRGLQSNSHAGEQFQEYAFNRLSKISTIVIYKVYSVRENNHGLSAENSTLEGGPDCRAKRYWHRGSYQ